MKGLNQLCDAPYACRVAPASATPGVKFLFVNLVCLSNEKPCVQVLRTGFRKCGSRDSFGHTAAVYPARLNDRSWPGAEGHDIAGKPPLAKKDRRTERQLCAARAHSQP